MEIYIIYTYGINGQPKAELIFFNEEQAIAEARHLSETIRGDVWVVQPDVDCEYWYLSDEITEGNTIYAIIDHR